MKLPLTGRMQDPSHTLKEATSFVSLKCLFQTIAGNSFPNYNQKHYNKYSFLNRLTTKMFTDRVENSTATILRLYAAAFHNS